MIPICSSNIDREFALVLNSKSSMAHSMEGDIRTQSRNRCTSVVSQIWHSKNERISWGSNGKLKGQPGLSHVAGTFSRGKRTRQPVFIWQLVKKLNVDLLYDPSIPFHSIYSPKVKTETQADPCIHMFIIELFPEIKGEGNSSIHQEVNELRKYGIYGQWNAVQILKRSKSCHLQQHG